MIATSHPDLIRVFHLESHEDIHHLHAVGTTVGVVTKKNHVIL